jgi:Ca2+-binding EF-hand superfamily protein
MDCTGVGLNLNSGTYAAGRAQRSPLDLDDAVNRLIKNKDKNGDGTLSASEMGISDAAFKQADANGDGQLDASEIKNNIQMIGKELGAHGRHHHRPPDLDNATQQLIKDLDQNGDGSLSSDEFGISKDVFSQADTNGDGQLSFDELKASAGLIGQELSAREAALKRYLLTDSVSQDSDGTTSLNLTI